MNKFIANIYSGLISAAWVIGIVLLVIGTFFALKAGVAPTVQILLLSAAFFVILVLGLGFVSVVIAVYETLKEIKVLMDRLESCLPRESNATPTNDPLMYP